MSVLKTELNKSDKDWVLDNWRDLLGVKNATRKEDSLPSPKSLVQTTFITKAELGIIGDNSTNRQQIYRLTLSVVGNRQALLKCDTTHGYFVFKHIIFKIS
jgi:hypothetical protein